MPTNLGRVRGSFIYNGNATSDSEIKSELSTAGALILDKDIYICNSSGNHPYFVYNASRDAWENKGTISGIDNFDSFLSISSTNGVQNKVISGFLNGLFKIIDVQKTDQTDTFGGFSLYSILKQACGNPIAPSDYGDFTLFEGICMIDLSPMQTSSGSATLTQITMSTRQAARFDPQEWGSVTLGTTKLLICYFRGYFHRDSQYSHEYFSISPIAFQESGGITFASVLPVSIKGTTPSISTSGGDCRVGSSAGFSSKNVGDSCMRIALLQYKTIS